MDSRPVPLFVLLLAAALVAGSGPARAAAIGVHLGVDRSGVDGDAPPNSEYTDKYGMVAGLQGEIDLAHDLSLSLQPSFVQKRSGVLIASSTRGVDPTERELAFDYFSVPLLLKFGMAGGRTYVSAGLSADFLSAATLADVDVKSAYKSTVFGALLGIGVVFPVGGARFTTELRLTQGLSNMNGGLIAETAGALAPRLHSSGLQLIVGSLIPVGKR